MPQGFGNRGFLHARFPQIRLELAHYGGSQFAKPVGGKNPFQAIEVNAGGLPSSRGQGGKMLGFISFPEMLPSDFRGRLPAAALQFLFPLARRPLGFPLIRCAGGFHYPPPRYRVNVVHGEASAAAVTLHKNLDFVIHGIGLSV
ncbi:MAG: hypothetical protein IT426_13665 [Pirellulales bacterium]|nr:hypothetical protein [Pirellulales bacterium]